MRCGPPIPRRRADDDLASERERKRRWGFVLFLGSSVSWTVAGLKMRENSLALLNGVFTAVNLLGIYRWLIA